MMITQDWKYLLSLVLVSEVVRKEKGSFSGETSRRLHMAMLNPIQSDESESQQHSAQWGVVNIYTKSLSSAHGWCLPATSVSNVVLHIFVIQAGPEIVGITPSIYEEAIQMWQQAYAKWRK